MDDLSLARDRSVTPQVVRAMVVSKQSTGGPDKIKRHYANLLDNLTVDCILGRIKRARSIDGGVLLIYHHSVMKLTPLFRPVRVRLVATDALYPVAQVGRGCVGAADTS